MESDRKINNRRNSVEHVIKTEGVTRIYGFVLGNTKEMRRNGCDCDGRLTEKERQRPPGRGTAEDKKRGAASAAISVSARKISEAQRHRKRERQMPRE
ncbi:hypothetical protein HPP92_005723 [Vanilla planifolia]|uniref:Uncharacterized protein n=1 Tax=Vanilla planifolia TaxID=51239 RepID=A0A835RSP1_VANPL|nr:hypothetical protein HPP92_005723 [Vanilla planifolia]